MTERASRIIELAIAAGIPADVFPVGWQADEFALYPDTVGASSTFDVAQQIAHEKAALRPWVLDLGSRAVSLTREQAELFRRNLDQANLTYSTGSVSEAYLKRIRRVMRDHDALLRELAKR